MKRNDTLTDEASPAAASGGGSLLDNPRVAAALEEYLRHCEQGESPDIEQFVAAHDDDIAEVLKECLKGLVFVQRCLPTIESSSADVGKAVAADSRFLERLTDYRILREVGRGGMGVVYEAEQVSLGRRVALKVLPFAAILDERQLARFKNEARSAAMLHHTNIVPVFSVGSERGVHFYAMQFIDGQTLAQVIVALKAQSRMGKAEARCLVEEERSARQSATADAPYPEDDSATAPERCSPSPRQPSLETRAAKSFPSDTIRDDFLITVLSEHRASPTAHFRTIARLGIQAAEALEHAHQHGVVHRDIKPANLMLDATGNLWIADFGLARLETDAGMTMTGDLIGTLRYMSPEQALGKRELVDHRTDIYSLGVTLFELLAHAPPFDGDDRAALLRQIANDEPQRLRRRNRAIPNELETIVQKALEKNPADRYATAQELANDLRRFLEDKPIHAKRTGPVKRAVKWVRRHKGLTSGLAAMMAMLIVALVFGSAAYQRGVEHRNEHEQRLAAEHHAQVIAEELGKRKIDVADLYSLRAISHASRKKHEEAIRDCDAGIAAAPSYALSYQNRGVFKLYLRRFAAAAEDFERAVSLGMDSADIYRNLGHCRFALDNYAEAIFDLTKSIERDGRLYGGHGIRALAYMELAQHKQALDDANKEIEISNSAYGYLVRAKIWDALGKTEPAIADASTVITMGGDSIQIGHAFFVRGKAYYSLAQLDKAVADLTKALQLSEQDNESLEATHETLGVCLVGLKDFDKAIGHLTTAITLNDRSPVAHGFLGKALNGAGRHREALIELENAIAHDPKPAPWHSECGTVYEHLKQFDKALVNHCKAIDLEPQNGVHYAIRGIYWINRERPDKAIDDLSMAIAKNIPLVGRAYGYRGEAQVGLGRFELAIEDFNKALQFDDPDPSLLAKWFALRGHSYERLRDFKRAIPSFTSAIELLKKHGHPVPHNCYQGRGSCFLEVGEFQKSIDDLTKAIEVHPDVVSYNNRGHSHLEAGQYSNAVADFEKACKLAPDDMDPPIALITLLANCPKAELRNARRAIALAENGVKRWPDNCGIWSRLGMARFRAGEWPTALAALDKAHQLRTGPEECISLLFFQAMTRWQLGDKQSAAKWYADATAAMDQYSPNYPELRQYRSETAKLLGEKDTSDDNSGAAATALP